MKAKSTAEGQIDMTPERRQIKAETYYQDRTIRVNGKDWERLSNEAANLHITMAAIVSRYVCHGNKNPHQLECQIIKLHRQGDF